MATYKRLNIVLTSEQNSQIERAIRASGLTSKQQFYRLAIAKLCDEYNIEFPDTIRQQASTISLESKHEPS